MSRNPAVAYDYLSERLLLHGALHTSASLRFDPKVWGAKCIQALVADRDIVITVTDTQLRDPATGVWVRTLSGWDLDRRRGFPDLHWCVDVHPPGGVRIGRQQANDTEHRSLLEAVRDALAYSLHELEGMPL